MKYFQLSSVRIFKETNEINDYMMISPLGLRLCLSHSVLVSLCLSLSLSLSRCLSLSLSVSLFLSLSIYLSLIYASILLSSISISICFSLFVLISLSWYAPDSFPLQKRSHTLSRRNRAGKEFFLGSVYMKYNVK